MTLITQPCNIPARYDHMSSRLLKYLFFLIFLYYLSSKRPWHSPFYQVCKMNTVSYYYLNVRERVCSSLSCVREHREVQMMDLGIVIDHGHAYVECLWTWIPLGITKVAIFGFS